MHYLFWNLDYITYHINLLRYPTTRYKEIKEYVILSGSAFISKRLIYQKTAIHQLQTHYPLQMLFKRLLIG